MPTRVYQFRCYPPTEGAEVVRAQLRAGHDYANDLVAIERGRRAAIRAIDDASPEVAEALSLVRAATRSTRRDAVRALHRARREAREALRCEGGHWSAPVEYLSRGGKLRYPYSPLYESERIALLDASIRRHARDLTEAHWGTYLVAEAAAQARRKPSKNSPDPCYEPDAVTPCDPRFRRFAPPHPSHYGSGCVAVQLQGGLSTPDALACRDTQVRLRVAGPISSQHVKSELSIRVGSEGSSPVWAVFPVRLSRAIPDAGRWKWVRVTCRHDGLREWWTCEITVETPAVAEGEAPGGTLAVEVAWDKPDESIHCAYWRDDAGHSGTIALPESVPFGSARRRTSSRSATRCAPSSPSAWLARSSRATTRPRGCLPRRARCTSGSRADDSTVSRTAGARRGATRRALRTSCWTRGGSATAIYGSTRAARAAARSGLAPISTAASRGSGSDSTAP